MMPPPDEEPDPIVFYIMKLWGYEEQYDWIFTKDQITVDFKEEVEAFEAHFRAKRVNMIHDATKVYHGVRMLFVSNFYFDSYLNSLLMIRKTILIGSKSELR
jgi:hypothetical protein